MFKKLNGNDDLSKASNQGKTMGNLNKVMLIGRVGQDVQKKHTNSGTSVATISIATADYYKDKNEERQEITEWHQVVLWQKLADLAEQYLSKGNQVYIEGSLKTEKWDDKDGNPRTTTKIIAQKIQFLPNKKTEDNSQPTDSQPSESEKLESEEFIEVL